MSTELIIRAKLTRYFLPTYLEVRNFSDEHAGPKGRSTHFEVVLVSDAFVDLNAVERQRRVFTVLEKELSGGVHALSLKTYTPNEWHKKKVTIPPPPRALN